MKILKRSPRPKLPPDHQAGPPDPRSEFFSIWAMLGKQRSQMFTITLLSLGVALTLLISYVRLAHASRFVPFLYIVDRSGEVLALGSARPIAADADPVIYNSLETFITSIRSVFQDPTAERFILKKAYAFLPADNPQSTSTSFLEAYMSNNDPRLLAQRLSRTAEIVSILKVPQPKSDRRSSHTSTWRVRWRETSYPVGTALGQASEWEAFATVRVHPKRTIEAFDPNPLGVYIDHLNWSRLTPEAHP